MRENRRQLSAQLKHANRLYNHFGKEAAYRRLSDEQAKKEALTLRADDKQLKDLFEEANLNPNDPLCWRILVEIFLDVYIAPKGRRKLWDTMKYSILYVDAEVASDGLKPKDRTNKAICQALRKLPAYKKISNAVLQKYLREARKRWPVTPLEFYSSDEYKSRMARLTRI
jgi:hypothetical protein